MVLDVNQHNKTVLGTLEVGDLVKMYRKCFQHWGVYIGNGDVVHKSGIDVRATDKASVKRESLLNVAGNSKMEKNNENDGNERPFPKEEIKKRALSRLGPASYNLVSDNCEHFATWCRYGISKSNQVDAAVDVGVKSIGTVVVVVGGGAAITCKANTSRNDSNKYGPFPMEEIKKRAPPLSRLEPPQCRFLCYNSEYFATLCRNEIHKSNQVNTAVADVGEGAYTFKAFTSRNDINMTCELIQIVDFKWPFPGGEMMEKTLLTLGNQSYRIAWSKPKDFAALFAKGIPVSGLIKTALIVVAVAVIVAAVVWSAYTLYTYRKELASGISSCCSWFSKTIGGFFGN